MKMSVHECYLGKMYTCSEASRLVVDVPLVVDVFKLLNFFCFSVWLCRV